MDTTDEVSDRYCIKLSTLPGDFPAGINIVDCTAINKVVEEAVLLDPSVRRGMLSFPG
jgi:hypothetical protein